MVRFLHLSDTHLGAMEYGIPEREKDYFDTFTEAINIGIEEDVDFIIHTGDLFDTNRPSNNALICLRDNMLRINEKGKKMYVIPGDHDRPKMRDANSARIFDFLGIEAMAVGDEPQIVDEKAFFIYAIGNYRRFRSDELKNLYRRGAEVAEKKHNTILMSHQAISPFFPPENCEADSSDLPANFSYMAFGHVHQFQQRNVASGIFSYAGSTELKSRNEIPAFLRQGKGVNIVDLEGDQASIKRRVLKEVRYQEEFSGLLEEVILKLEETLKKNFEKKPLLHITVNETVSRKTVENAISSYRESAIIMPPIINSQEEESHILNINEGVNARNIFNEFFKNEIKGGIAYDIFNYIKKEGNASEINEIRKLMDGWVDDN